MTTNLREFQVQATMMTTMMWLNKKSEKLVTNDILEGIDDVKCSFILPPGIFEIIWCVDTMETKGKGRMKKELADKIAAGNVTVDR